EIYTLSLHDALPIYFRVKQVEDIVKLGDEIWVKCLGVDEKGRVRLSRKAAMAERDQEMSGTPRPEGPEGQPQGERGDRGEREDRGDRRGDRGDRGERRGDRG